MSKPLESKIESHLKKQIARIGGLCYKWKSTVNGVPDQIVIYDGHTYFVEVKRPGEVPRANQVHVHNQIHKQGVPVYTVSTIEEVDQFICDTMNVELPAPKGDPSKPKILGANAFKLS